MKNDVAVFTITRNEPFYLKLWCNYYCNIFPQEHIYVLDNSTTDGSVEEIKRLYPGVNVVPRPSKKAFVHIWLKETVENFQRELLNHYRCAVFVETDEFLIPSTEHKDLAEYCQKFLLSNKSYVRARCFSIVHQFEFEPTLVLTPGCDILADRNSMWRLPSYDKTLITKTPLMYSRGFHNIFRGGAKIWDDPLEPDLDLLHAWQIDINMYHDRYVKRQAQLDIAEKANGSTHMEDIKTYFRTNVAPWDTMNGAQNLEKERFDVPKHWKGLLKW